MVLIGITNSKYAGNEMTQGRSVYVLGIFEHRIYKLFTCMHRPSINMYKYVFIFFWISVLYNGTAIKAAYRKLDTGLKAVLRCAPPNADYAIEIIQHFQTGNFTGITKLNMASCNIKQLSPGLFKFQALIQVNIIRLSNNRISRLPFDLFHSSALFSLEKLYLDHNQITYLAPKQFVYLYNLRYLDLSFNKLTNMEPRMFATNSLVSLCLSRNYLEKMPGNLFAGNASKTLKVLKLKHNILTEIPPCLFQLNASEGNFPKLEVLNLNYNKIKQLPTQLFNSTNWSSLRSLNLQHNSLTGIPPGIFSPLYLKNMIRISLSYNNLTTFSMNSSALINLQYLSLNHNQITSLTPKEFVHLKKLRDLGLNFNNIKYLEPGLFTSNLLISLRLSGNWLETVPDNLFAGKISKTLKVLRLRRNLLTAVPQCFYQSNASKAVLLKLRVLDLSYNNINDLPNDLFNSSSWSLLRSMDISHNKISILPDGIFQSVYLFSLKKLNLSFNNLKTLSKYLFHNHALSNLCSLRLSHNQITVLPEELFHSPYLQSMSEIDFENNKINSVPVHFFKYLPNLKKILLKQNSITYFSEDMLPNTLHHLCELNLCHNKITSTGELVKTVLGIFQFSTSEKCKLDLSYNSLTVQQTNFFPIRIGPKQTRLQIQGNLYLSYNNISKFEVVSCETLPLLRPLFSIKALHKRKWLGIQGNKIFSVVNLVQAALQINLNHIELGPRCNPNLVTPIGIHRLNMFIEVFPYQYNCNCDMVKYLALEKLDYFKKAADRYRRFKMYWSNSMFNSLKCGSPKHLQGKFLYQLKEIEMQCAHSRCTYNTKCICTETPYNSTVRINCTERKIKLMQPFIKQNSSKVEIYMGFNGILEFPIANISISLHVILLDLSFNYITHISSTMFSHYPNLTDLNLAGNHLTTIPSADEWKIMNSLINLEFRENNFTCNCSGLILKETLVCLNARSGATVKDLDLIKCASPLTVKDKIIYNLPDSLFGCPYLNLVTILTSSLSVLLFLSVVIFMAYIFRYYISLFLFIHFGWRFCYSYKKDETLYDAFISYSCQDSDWVIEQLMNPLENLNPPYNLCLHERDFLVGVPICDNITKAIEGSKCTVCVVSRNWLESNWCQFEFRVAHCLATVEKKTRLLVILKEEIPNAKIKGDLKFYMKTFTYLDSSHPLFWSRLLNDLPRPDMEEGRDRNDQWDDAIELM